MASSTITPSEPIVPEGLPIEWVYGMEVDPSDFLERTYTLHDVPIVYRNNTYKTVQVELEYSKAEAIFGAAFLSALAQWQVKVQRNPALKVYTSPFYFKADGTVNLKFKLKGPLKNLHPMDKSIQTITFKLSEYRYEGYAGLYVEYVDVPELSS